MERKKRTVFAVLIATIIVLAVFSSFAINLFGGDNYEIKLPDLSADQGSDGPGSDDDYGAEMIRVEINPQTVQRVIEKTLVRPASYYRDVRIELWVDEETSAVTTAQVWVDEGWTRTEVITSNGKTQHNIVGEDTHWLWYDEEKTALSFPAKAAAADLVQRIPTYEDVLELPRREITNTGYEKYDGVDCIFVEIDQRELGTRERYWVAVSDGLLLAAERTTEEGAILYRMTSSNTESPAPLNSDFTLPDGTVLHTVDGE